MLKEFVIVSTFSKTIEASSEEEAMKIWEVSECNGDIENVDIEVMEPIEETTQEDEHD